MLKKFLLFTLVLFSMAANCKEEKISLTLVSVIKPEMQGFSTSGLGGIIGAVTIPYVGQIVGDIAEASISKEKYSKDLNATVQSKEVTNIIVNQVKNVLISTNKFDVTNESYAEEGDMVYQTWLEKKDRLSINDNEYICEIGIGKIRLEDQFFSKLMRAEFAIKIIHKNEILNIQATSFGDFMTRWELVESTDDKSNGENIKKAYIETLNKISGKLAKALVDKI